MFLLSPSIRYDRFGRSQDTHNLYLEIATNLGIQGCILFYLLIYNTFKMLNRCKKDLGVQIIIMSEFQHSKNHTPIYEKIISHYKDLKLISAVCDSVILFITLRLVLGFFGMDLYEIYWWFSIGIAISLNGILKVASDRTAVLY